MSSIYDCLKPVESSMFSRAGYHDASWHLLFEFKSTGEIRSYEQVAPEVADDCLTSESIGKWWNGTVRGNSAWIYEVLGADPNAPPLPVKEEKKADKAKSTKKPPASDMGITVEDIQNVDPSYQPSERGINGLDACIGDEDHPLTTWPTYGGIDRSQTTIHMSEVADWPKDDLDMKQATLHIPGEHTFQCGTGEMGTLYWSKDADPEKLPDMQEHFSEQTVASLATQPIAEIMGKWTAPESAAEALELLSERETEIEAIIASCKEAGQSALTVKVTDADSRVKAGEVLTSLVVKKDKATELLEPFRKQLYEVYQYAGGKKSAALDPLEAAIKQVKNRCLAWEDEQRRIKAEADRKAREAADAESRRLQEEEAQRLTLAEMQDRLDEGDEKGAEDLFDKVIEVPRRYVPPIYTSPVTPTIEGQSSSQKYKVDESPLETPEGYLDTVMTLLRSVKDDKIELRLAATYLRWDLVALNKLAGALKTAFFVPGLSAKPVSNMSVRRK